MMYLFQQYVICPEQAPGAGKQFICKPFPWENSTPIPRRGQKAGDLRVQRKRIRKLRVDKTGEVPPQ
jgi:hypothetical protein